MNQPLSTKPSPLGRGLSALFGDADNSFQARPAAVQAVREKIASSSPSPSGSPQVMPIAWLQPGAYQPRRKFDEAAIVGLAESIRERGVLQPLMVRPIEGEKDAYEILAGERRWRAAQRVGLHEVPVVVRPFTDQEAMEIGLIENVQREGLTPLEEAEGYKRLLEEFNHSQENLAKVIGKSRPHITNMLRLLNLPPLVKQMLDSGALSAGHARAIAAAPSPETLAQEIVKRGLSVRQTEALAKKAASPKPQSAKAKAKLTAADDADIQALERELIQSLGLKVKITAEGQAGSLTIHYRNLDQLEAILVKLKK